MRGNIRTRRSRTAGVPVLLTVALLCFVLTGLGAAFGAEGNDSTAAGEIGGDTGSSENAPGIEIPEKRTAASETFRLPNGALETRIYQSPIHYQSLGGDWKPIDESLIPAEPVLTNGANAFDLQLPGRLGAGPVLLAKGDKRIALELLGETTDSARVEDNLATYKAAQSDVAFELTSLSDGVKENIRIANPSAPATYSFALRVSAGITPLQMDDGSIILRDGDSQAIAVLPPPIMYDSSPASAISEEVRYQLDERDDDWLLSVNADRDWLAQPERIWPVVIDPSVTFPAPNLDCVYGGKQGESGWRACGSSTQKLTAGYWPKLLAASDEWKRSAIRFDVSSLPTNTYVNSATLGLYSPSNASNTTGVEAIRGLKSWTSSLNWKTYNGQNLWTSEGGDYESGTHEWGTGIYEGASVLTADRGNQSGWWEFSGYALRTVVQDWILGSTPNQGLIVKLLDDKARECGSTSCTSRVAEFNSSSTPEASLRPYLKLIHYPPAPSTSKVTFPKEGTVTGRRLKLRADWSVQGVTGVSFEYKVLGTPMRFKPIPTEFVRKANGNSVSWPMPAQGKQSEPLYFDAYGASSVLISNPIERKLQIRAVFEGSAGATGYTSLVNAIVNPNAGGSLDATTPVAPGSVNLLTGNFTLSRTDVSIPVFDTALEFSRSYSSRVKPPYYPEDGSAPAEDTGVLGRGWTPTVPVEAAGGAAWRKIRDASAAGEGSYAVLTDLEGYEYGFELSGGTYISPPGGTGWLLTRQDSTHLAMTDPNGNRTIFEKESTGYDYVPVAVSQPGDSTRTTRMVYQLVNGKKRLSMIIGPAASTIECIEATAASTVGCRVLTFSYQAATTWGAPASYGSRLSSITFHNATGQSDVEVARYSYNADGRLVQQWDPRISPALKETYAYGYRGPLQTLTPPGEEPWTLEYAPMEGKEPGPGEDPILDELRGRLVRVKRPSLLSSPSIAQTTIVYDVPVSGSGGPYDMSAETVAKWGQQDIPTDATAIFPPDQIPSSPSTSYSRATLFYMDAEGMQVNSATPAGAGTSTPSITTTETDEYGNVMRELTAQNRLRALAAGANSVSRSHELETKRSYNSNGTEMQEEWGPLHEVRLESGSTVQARQHRTIEYDQGAPTPPTGTPWPHLPTRETVGASISGQGIDADQRVTETKYSWTLRKPTDTIVDPGGLNLRTHVEYSETTGLPIERRLPANPNGGDARTTKLVYYTPLAHPTDSECGNNRSWSRWVCKIMPGGQTAGQPELLVKRITGYSSLGQPTEVVESAGGGTQNTRVTKISYDAAGRPSSSVQAGGGISIPKVENLYSSATGRPLTRRFVCQSSCESFDNQATTTTYDTLGRPILYQDADGNTSSTSYDLLGRPVTTSDGKGIQTRTYDPVTGLLVKLEDSGVGTFTAGYDADGNLVEQLLPNGLAAQTSYDETGEPVHLRYQKTTNCLTECTWLEFDAEESVHGQWLSHTSTMSSQQYTYDKAGRLKLVKDTNAGGSCTTRAYTYDDNSNRTSLVTRQPGIGGACDTSSAGALMSYSYDAADRLLGAEIGYDNYGRITSLPSAYSGGGALTTTYYTNDLVKSQTQDGITNTYELDSAMRQRQRMRSGAQTGTEIYHYGGESDSPAWIDRGSGWTRNVVGIDGALVATQESGGSVLLGLLNLHGDIVGAATSNPEATKPYLKFEFDEFGNPKSTVQSKWGWLGGKQRRTELPSGIIQMGVRTYVPAIGRFLSPDPMIGGSANAYEYGMGDPVNQFDLDGLKARKRRAAARASISVPCPLCGVRRKLGDLAAGAAKKAWSLVKGRTREIASASASWTTHLVSHTLDVVARWDRKLNPFAVPSLQERLSCVKGGLENFVEAIRSLPTPTQKIGWIAAGCLESAYVQ